MPLNIGAIIAFFTVALLPAGLLAWASQIGAQAESTSNWGAVTLSIVIILVCLISAGGVFERQEL